MSPTEQAIACLQRAIAHIEIGDPNDIENAWVEMAGARLWTRHMHPRPDKP